MLRHARLLLTLAVLMLSGRPAVAQQKSSDANLPDSPTPKQTRKDQNEGKNPFATPFGLIAKRSYVYPELATTARPLSAKEKFELFLSKSSSPPQILSSMAGAGIGQARNALPGYGQGWPGYGKRFGASIASGASSHFFGTFVLPSVLREDPRYFVMLKGTWQARVGHALRRVLVIRTNDGNETFNIPGTLGPLLAESLATVYLPDSERTTGKTFQRFGVRIGFGAANNLIKEYWPTIFKNLRINKVAPDLRPDPAPHASPDRP